MNAEDWVLLGGAFLIDGIGIFSVGHIVTGSLFAGLGSACYWHGKRLLG